RRALLASVAVECRCIVGKHQLSRRGGSTANRVLPEPRSYAVRSYRHAAAHLPELWWKLYRISQQPQGGSPDTPAPFGREGKVLSQVFSQAQEICSDQRRYAHSAVPITHHQCLRRFRHCPYPAVFVLAKSMR